MILKQSHHLGRHSILRGQSRSALLMITALMAMVLVVASVNRASADAAGAGRYLIDVPVVELFTSQGCPNCPKADSALATLANKGEVLALSVHVDYWNYNGWADRYSSAENTQRQLQYKDVLEMPYVFTPQFVANGKLILENQALSSFEKTLDMLAIEPNAIVAEIVSQNSQPGVSLNRQPADKSLDVRFVLFDRPMMTVPSAGRNRGKTIVNAHPVSTWLPVHQWQNGSVFLRWPETDSYGTALLVSDPGSREILLSVARLAPTVQ